MNHFRNGDVNDADIRHLEINYTFKKCYSTVYCICVNAILLNFTSVASVNDLEIKVCAYSVFLVNDDLLQLIQAIAKKYRVLFHIAYLKVLEK